jgi:hypothetical protein
VTSKYGEIFDDIKERLLNGLTNVDKWKKIYEVVYKNGSISTSQFFHNLQESRANNFSNYESFNIMGRGRGRGKRRSTFVTNVPINGT